MRAVSEGNMSEPFVGEIRMGGFNFAPQGWAFCDGSLLAISEYDVLFDLLGTTYGGDGQTTFALPNLLGRVPIHQGLGYLPGQSGGTETVALTTAQMASHTHAISVENGAGTLASPNGNYFAETPSAVFATPGTTEAMGSVVSTMGGSLPHDNIQPYQAITYIISLFGVFPSQN